MDQFIHEIKTFEDACKVEGLDIEEVNANLATVPVADRRSELDRISMVAYAKLLIVARAINRLANGGNSWVPDWSNPNQYKYYPWFEMRGSSGFRFDDDGDWRSGSGVGSRLCFINYEAAQHAGKQFQDLYEEFMVIDTASVKARKSKIVVNGAETLVDVNQNTSVLDAAQIAMKQTGNVARPITDYIFFTAAGQQVLMETKVLEVIPENSHGMLVLRTGSGG